MQGVYTAWGEIATITTGKTLLYITAPATASVEILEAHATMRSDTAAEQASFGFRRVTSLGSPTDSAAGVKSHENLSAAKSSTCRYNVTANEPTYDDTTTLDGRGVLTTTGYHHEPAPEARIIIPPGGTVGLRCLETIGSSNWTVSITFREIG